MKTLIISISFLIICVIFYGYKDKGSENKDNVLIISEKQLDANNISTWYRNNGSFNRIPESGNAGFEWPKTSNKFARYASGMWLGAKVNNDTLLAVCEYDYEYSGGYTDNNGIPQGKNDPLYRIYRMTYQVNDPDRQNWPNILLGNSDQGAPVIFENNMWKPLDFGTQTMFYRYTDSYPEDHGNRAGSTAPLKADVMQLNFSSTGELADVIISEFTVINRNNTSWNNAYYSIWTDDDIGGTAQNDKVGCDTSLSLGYTYKANINDPQYGSNSPAVGFLLLRGALEFTGNSNDTVYICKNKTRTAKIRYRDKSMSSFNTYINGNPGNGDPRNYREAYNRLAGLKSDGTQWINPLTNAVTKYVYPGDPVTSTGWNDPSADDKRFMMSSGPVNSLPGDTQTIVVAQIIARGTTNLNSITLLKELARRVINYYKTCYSSPIGIEPQSTEIPKLFALYQNYPNPFNPVTVIRYSLTVNRLTTLKIYNILGEEVSVLANEIQRPGTYEVSWEASNYPSGVYYYQLKSGDFSQTKRMVLMK